MNKKIICVICVRGNSKRLKRKNMQMYGNKTLVQHAIDRAMESNYIRKVVFGTEDEEIINHVAEIKEQYEREFEPESKPLIEIYELTKEITQGNVSMYAPVREILQKNPDYPIAVVLQVDQPVIKGLIDKCIEKFFEMDEKIRGEKIDDDKQYFEEVSTFHNNVRTGSVRVITRDAFLSPLPTSKIAMVEDTANFVDIQFQEDLDKANYYLLHPRHDTFWVSAKIKEPIEYNTRMILNHFNRYLKAVRKLKITEHDVVLDASCGQGYGTFILSLFAGRAYGFDTNKDYIEKAKQYYPYSNFYTYKEAKIYDYWNINKIVCIETFEHIPKDEIGNYLGELFDYLPVNGDMFVTCPIGNDGPSSYNEFHLNEPSLPTIKRLLLDRFKKSKIVIDTLYNAFNEWQEYCMIALFGYKGE